MIFAFPTAYSPIYPQLNQMENHNGAPPAPSAPALGTEGNPNIGASESQATSPTQFTTTFVVTADQPTRQSQGTQTVLICTGQGPSGRRHGVNKRPAPRPPAPHPTVINATQASSLRPVKRHGVNKRPAPRPPSPHPMVINTAQAPSWRPVPAQRHSLTWASAVTTTNEGATTSAA